MRSLAPKLILAFLIVSLAGTVLLAVSAGQVTATEFGHFMFMQNQEATAAELSAYYEAQGSWAGVEDAFGSGNMRGRGGGRRGLGPGGMGMGPGGNIALADSTGRVVVAGLGYPVGQQLSATELAGGIPIQVDGRVVGTLLAGGGAFAVSQAGAEFLDRVNQVLVIAAVGATAVALVLGVVLARTLTRPLRELTAATKAVAGGNLGQQVPVRSQDELGQLAASFNQMSEDLARSRDLRRQMTADIAHDLRTPISIILGHAEGVADGVLPPTPESFHVIHDEAQRLNRLVEELRTLSLAEAGELSLTPGPVSPRSLLERAAIALKPQARQQNVTLRVEAAPDLPQIEVDADRTAQVLGNLLQNALQHTPAGGTITLAAQSSAAALRLSVSDTGPGIAAADLPRLFHRFYRADKSRQRHEGGSGLGLAIAKSLVEAHNGRIWAESEPGLGATFIIELPL